ncbi:DUF3267 domain-containing protein [Radiobacillus sp. PE A8.2]|uniref:DUF3267 domain-containing protein n=1 Tax=Radiobacillus sp. PE A8.2 TaxID=3380349 RepID=UPI0038910E44
MNCWKTVNVSREFGHNRIYIISLILGLLSFIFLYLPFSMIHHSNSFQDHGVLPLLLGMLALPMMHKMMHILPLIIGNKKIKVKMRMRMRCIPIFSYLTKSKMSKRMSVLALLAPTIFITIPGLIASYIFVEYYAYIILFTSINIGLSFTDFIYAIHMMKAPRKCIIENAKDGYDILI